ncbi:MAG TPA: DUF1223 domain-containing protein [Caulobacteraceae bacterium]|jgi:hypothetical protein|nr:DUF1223 domain-containing protein [Caulobacteraceae bacterium]
MRIRTSLVALLIAGLGLAPAAGAEPTVVELFQSQGCSSCPPADANLNAIADRPDVLALSFAVTYWDQLGWKDTFASRAFTARQYAYMRGLGHSNLATPQIVLNGRHDVVGVDSRELAAAVHAAGAPAGASLSVSRGMVSVSAGAAPASGADVWLVRYDPRVQWVAIRRGENGGKTLPHRDIVRQLTRLGGWFGAARSFPLPGAGGAGLKTAILVQTTGGGPILAAAKL